MRAPYTPPTLRQLSRGELTDEQAAWIETTRRRTWSLGEIGAFVIAGVMTVGAVALAFVVLSLVSGCAMADPVYVDRRFDASERAEIQQAADYWCRASDGAACIDLVFGERVGPLSKTRADGRRELVRATEAEAMRSPSEILRSGRDGVRWLNYDELGVRSGETIVLVPTRIADGFFRTVAAHELGHHFGMNHVATVGALMVAEDMGAAARSHVEDWCLSAADVAELCNSHDCGHPRECAP